MKTFLFACAALALAGCTGIGDVAHKRAAQACAPLQGTDRYGDCYAQAYQTIYANESASGAVVGSSMIGASGQLLSTPPRSTVTCTSNAIGTTCY